MRRSKDLDANAVSDTGRAERIREAYFIKLGSKGSWEEDSLRNGILRFGWRVNPLPDILAHDWEAVRKTLAQKNANKGSVTADVNRLKDIVLSTPEDVWVTFHRSTLWWCRLSTQPPKEDATSRYRTTLTGWSNTDITGKKLVSSQIPGSISKTQGYRATVCSIKERDVLERLINASPSPERVSIETAHSQLVTSVIPAVRQLHWKDFETLVDLIFRAAGWKRVSVIGETVKDVDLELEEPFTQERYQVQIKASASKSDFLEAAEGFSPTNFRSFYFIVHSPSRDLAAHIPSDPNIKLVFVEQLAEMTIRAGLVDWLMAKVW